MDKKAYLNAMSGLMLEGWTMMNRTCPQPGCSSCALLQDRSGAVIQCVGCNTRFVLEENAGAMLPSPTKSNGSGGFFDGSDDYEVVDRPVEAKTTPPRPLPPRPLCRAAPAPAPAKSSRRSAGPSSTARRR